ncbi:hypothetical protein [Vibrio breoganii]|uniref:hypothetical protein n=1 Tax=Vibrio breoganii TaxID=553239 RepID=UPI0003139A2B|nr:hypothetical protein [Vibrio breoganii]
MKRWWNHFFILFLCCSLSTYAQSESFLVSGYGDSEKTARVDAKQQLALQIFSRVKVNESSHLKKEGNNVVSLYEQQSTIESLPIEIQSLNVKTTDCSQTPCRYEFTVDKTPWIKKLILEIQNSHSHSLVGIERDSQNWSDLKLLFESKKWLEKNEAKLMVLSALDASEFNHYATIQMNLEQQLANKEAQIAITFRSGVDPFSSKVKGVLSNTAIASSNGDFNIYIKGDSRYGQKGNEFVAKQNISLKVFDAFNPGVVISQKDFSQVATSKESSAQALERAQNIILKTLSQESIFTLLN